VLPFLAALRWARARLDFDAVIRASPPVWHGCWRDCTVRVLSQP
jgi:hypothetical protein